MMTFLMTLNKRKRLILRKTTGKCQQVVLWLMEKNDEDVIEEEDTGSADESASK